MAESLTALFEFCQRAVFRTGGEVSGAGCIHKGGGVRQYPHHLVRIMLPVGGGVEQPLRLDDASQLVNERRLQNPPFVVLFLVPRIGKEQHGSGQGVVGQGLEDLNGVVTHRAQVVEIQLLCPQQQMTHAWAMDLDAEIVTLGVLPGERGQGFAVTETDLDPQRMIVAESLSEIQHAVPRKVDAPTRPKFFEGALLAGGQASFAQDEAADTSMVGIRFNHRRNVTTHIWRALIRSRINPSFKK